MTPHTPPTDEEEDKADAAALLYRVSLASATFGLVVRDGIVIEAAPIARRMVGRTLTEAQAYYGDALAPVPDWQARKERAIRFIQEGRAKGERGWADKTYVYQEGEEDGR